jgi:transcriptional regulator of acetoin/glycerol metabolism
VAAVIRGLSPAAEPAKTVRSEVAEAFTKSLLASHSSGSKLEEAQRAIIAHALVETQGNVSAAARLLGVERKALERKVRRYRLR